MTPTTITISPLYKNDFGYFLLGTIPSKNQIVLKWGYTPETINPGVTIQIGHDYDLEDAVQQILKKIQLNDKRFMATFKKQAKPSLKRGNYPLASASIFSKKKKIESMSIGA